MKTVNNYLKNVMKSVAYAAADVSNDYIPNMKEFASSNKEFATATYATLKNPAQSIKRSVKAIQESKVYKALDYGARNLSEDLRTGNFYNKARKDRDELALSGLDTDWDDLSEFGIDNDWEKNTNSSSSKPNDEITAGDLKIVESIEGSNAALASATVNAVITASQNEIKNNRANMGMLYMQNEKLFGGLHKDITVLGSTMQQMYKLQSASLQNIDKNMSSFFTQESKLSTERNAILKEILELQRNVYKSASDKEKEANSKNKSGRIRWNDINVNGIVDINAYFNAVRKNISNQLATVMPAGFGEDSNMLATFMTSPLEGVMKYVVNGVIPATVKAAAKELDGTISGVFGNIIGALGNARSKNDGGLLGTIAKFLGVSTSVNRNIDTSRYEKGPVPFDGITRKAIIDVIPTHLRRIEAAITGRPEEMFDYKTGRWIKVSNVRKQFEDIKKNAVKRATSEIREAMNPGVQAVRKGMEKSDRDDFDEAIEQFEQFLYDNNGRFNSKVSASKNGISSYNYGKLYKHYDKIRKIFNEFDVIESENRVNGKRVTRNTKNSIRAAMSRNVLDVKESEEKQYRAIESDVGSVFQSLFGVDLKSIDKHGKYKDGKFEAYNTLKNTTDKLGNTIFDYLLNINKELTWFRKNGIPGGGGSSSASSTGNTSMQDIERQLNKSGSNNSNYEREMSNRERDRKTVLDAIASGKAIDLRDFNIDQQAYLLQLSAMLKNNSVEEYQSEIKGYNNKAISSFMDKHFFKTNIKSMRDIEKAIKKADEEGKNTNEVKMDAKEEKFFKKIMNRIGAGGSIFSGIVGASAEAFTNLLYTADKAIYEMMYKVEIDDGSQKQKKKYNGFIDAMVGKMTDSFKKISDKFKEDVIDPFKERLGIDDSFKGRFKDSLKNTGSRLWTSFKDANTSVYGPMWHEAQAMLGLNNEQSRMQKKRTANRESIKSKVNKVNNIENLYDDELINLLREYGLDFAKYKTADEARTALLPLLYEDMYKNSNELREFDGNEEILDMALKALLNNPERILKSGKRLGTVIQGDTDDDRIKYIKDQIYRRADKSKQARRDRQAALGKGSDNSDLRAILAEEYGFIGTVEQKQEMLKSLAKEFNVSVKNISRYDTDDALNKAYIRIIENHNAKGTIGQPFTGLTTLTKGETLINGSGVGMVPKTGVYNVTTPTHILNRKDTTYLTTGRNLSYASIQNDLGKEKLAAKAAGFNVADNARGTIKITNDGVDINTEEFLSEVKRNIPEAAAGGLVGGILSLVLGTVGGPLLGAAVGAGGSILASSDNLKNKLFGKAGSDGKRDGSGIISKTAMDAFNKYFPDMAKYGLAGIIPGLITPLGPIGGLLVGGTIGYLKNNERFTNKYFGEKGALHIKSKEKKIIQDMLPGALKGAGAGIIAKLFLPSPFGIVGNAAIGAAIGMMASTEEFKEGILGKEINGVKTGGIVNTIKDAFEPLTNSMKSLGERLVEVFENNIIDPISRFITPAIHAIPQIASIIPRKINEHFMKSDFKANLDEFFKEHVTKPLGKVVEKVITPIGKTAMNVITSPVRLLGWAGDKIRRRQILTGNADYMTARERIEWMKQNKKEDKISATDRVLADIGTNGGMSVDTANKLSTDITSIISTEREAIKSKKSKEREINKVLNSYKTEDGKGLSKKAREDLRKAMEAGDMDRIRVILSTYTVEGGDTGLSKEQIDSLMKDPKYDLGSKITSYMHIKDQQNAIANVDKEQMEGQLGELFEKLGIDPKKIKDRHFMAKFAKNLETEVLDRKANETGKGELALETENNQIFKDIAASVSDIKTILYSIRTGDTDVLKDLELKHIADYEQSINSENSNLAKDYAARNERNSSVLGEEFFNALNPESQKYLSVNSRNKVNKKKSTKINANIRLINQYEMTPDEVNACNGNVYKLSQIMKHGLRVNVDAIATLNDNRTFDQILYSIKKTYIRRMLKVRNITIEDIKFLSSLNKHTIVLLNNKCEYLLKRYDPMQFKSLEQAMNFEGDRTGEGIEENPAVPISNRIKKGAKSIWNFVVHGDANYEKPIQQNGIGTMLLNGASSIFNAGKSVVKGAGSLVKSLFKKKKKNEDGANQNAGILASLLGAGRNLFGGNINVPTSTGNLDENDKPGDGRDPVQVGEDGTEIIQMKNGKPDTSDSKTKAVMNKLQLKEKAMEKLRDAQFKASEIIKTTFDTSSIKESKGGKLGWFSLLLGGTILWKSGILKKLFDGVIKPIWTDHLKPWITDTAVPWIKGIWTDKIKPFLTDTVGPWIINTAIPAIGNVFSTVVGVLISKLPSLIASGIKGLVGGSTTTLDVATGNKYNAGTTTRVDSDKLVEENGEDFVTGMYDEDGNALTAGDIKSGNFKEIYNAQGIKGYIDKNGNPAFDDDSVKGASYVSTVANAAARGFAKSAATGRVDLLTKATTGIGKKLFKSKGLLKKAIGGGTLALSKPVEAAEKAGIQVRNGWISSIVDKAADNIIKKAAANGELTDELLETIAKGDGSRTSKVITKIANWTDNGIVGRSRDAASSISSKVKNAASGIKSKAKNLFKTSAKEATEEAVENSAESAIKEGAESVAAKATKEATEEVVKKATNKAVKETVEEAGEKITKAAASVSDDVAKASTKNSGLLSKLIAKAKDAIAKLLENSTVKSKLSSVAKSLGVDDVSKWISKFKNTVDDIFANALEKGAKKVGTETCKKALSKVLTLVFLVTDFVTGCDQAEAILGVLKTSIVEELVAGLLNALCNFLIIPSIVPGTNFIARKIYEFFDKDLESRQAEATTAYEKYVQETGSTLTQEEWLKRKYSTTGKIGGWFSDNRKTFKKVANVISNPLLSATDAVVHKFTSSDSTVRKVYDKASNALHYISNPVSGVKALLHPIKTVKKIKNSLFGKDDGENVLSNPTESFKRNLEEATATNANGTISLSQYLSGTNNQTGVFKTILGNMTDNLGDLNKDFKFDDLNRIMDRVKNGKISIFSKDYWKLSNKSNNTFKDSLNNAHSMLTRIMNVPMLMVKGSLDGLVSDTEEIGSALTGYNIASTTTNTKITSTKTTLGSKIKDLFYAAITKIKNLFGSGTGSYKYGTGIYSKQIDPSISGIRFNTSSDKEYQTIGDSGCGPAAAVNAIESMYGRGNAVVSAAKFAINRGYKETNGGTRPEFFTDYFNRNGFGSQTSYNKADIERNINSGMPTVIMGRDAKGTSSSTPFGKTPHYVTVTGIDGRGNAIVQDPESKYDNQLYPLKSLMKNTSLGVSAFGKSYKSKHKFGRGKWGRGNYDAQIWWYLKQMGMTDAGAAGLMGNLDAESGLMPNNAENAVNKYTGMDDDQYTAAVDNGTIDKNTFLHPKGGSSQYGYGLAQWTSPGRKEGLYNLVKQKNVSISDLGTQLEWLGSELSSGYSNVLNILKTSNNLAETSNAVLTGFEKPADQGLSVQLKRQGYGQKYLSAYQGTSGEEINGTTLPQTTSSSTSGSTTTTSTSGGISGLINTISSSFSDILNNSNAGQAFSLITNAISSIGNSSSTTTSTSVGSTTGSTNSINTGKVGTGDAANMVSIAKNEVGIKEGSNDSVKYNDWYWGKSGYPWCAAFVSWVANQAGIPTTVIPKDAYTVTSYDKITGTLGGSKITGSNAQAGDIIYFSKNGSPNGIYHTGIVSGNQNGIISTIEGNSGKEGVVGEYNYNSSDSKILVARPNYANAGTAVNYSNTSAISDIPSYSDTRGGNGAKPLSRFGQFKDSIYGKGSKASQVQHRTKDGYIRVEYSNVDKQLGNAMKSSAYKNKSGKGTLYGMGTAPDYSKLINSIIGILMTIADNTDKLNLIVTILNEKLNLGISASDVSNATTGAQSLKSKLSSALNGINSSTSKFNTYADSVGDTSINAIISAMNAIASE